MHFACLGIGVGPSNLSLAALLYSHKNTKNIFFEKNDDFTWHEGLQLSGTFLQVSLFKDLVLLADPTNQFSFISYLHSQGRIYHFLNAQFDRVSRQEFRNYMEWAGKSNPNIIFGEEVVSVDIGDNFIVETTKRKVTADNISVGVGIKPYVPDFATEQLGQTQFHISEFAWRAKDVGGKRIVIIGGGQSGAEACLDLISRPTAKLPEQVTWISRRPNFLPLDDTPFVNDCFMPCFSDHFYNLDRTMRGEFVSDNILSSDGISEPTLRQIYQQIYMHEFVDGKRGLVTLAPNRTVTQIFGHEGNWQMQAQHIEFGGNELLTADVVVWATGYRTADMNFLKPIEHRFEREGEEYRIDADFSVQWDGPPNRRIFMQNASPKQRGLAERNLSLLAWRSQRILDQLNGVRTTPQLPSFLEWTPTQPAHKQKLG